MPRTEGEAIKSGEWLYKGKTKTHNLDGSSENKDYRGIGERAGQQAIYDKNENLITTPENMGTYDFGNPVTGAHREMDIKPWLRWGNSPRDTTTQLERVNTLSWMYYWFY